MFCSYFRISRSSLKSSIMSSSSGDEITFSNVGTIIFRQPGNSGDTRKIILVNKEEIVVKKFAPKAPNEEKIDGRNLVFDQDISRRHAKVSYKNCAFFIEDIKSTNGTYHNDKKLEQNKEYQLESGDNIRFGQSFILMIEICGSTTYEASPLLNKFTEKKLNLIGSAANNTKGSQEIESNDKEESPMQKLPSVSSTKGKHFQ